MLNPCESSDHLHLEGVFESEGDVKKVAVVRVFIMRPGVEQTYQPISEEQLIKRVDNVLAHVQAGLFEDAEDVERELRAEFGF